MTERQSVKPHPERRRDSTLREMLDDLVEHVRQVAKDRRDMTPDELEYARERMAWLSDEIWHRVLEEGSGNE
ncbi:MAG: hypothetical protein O7I93_05415 [Gemmatimonadetes bacterium]|nr:hypothetical protein [Gemmatimonadota bacterium]